MTALSVGAGGFLGALCRFLLIFLYSKVLGYHSPTATLLVNALGTLIMGILLGMFQNTLSHHLSAFLFIGFLGSFTTFSAFSHENYLLLSSGLYLKAFLHIAFSLLIPALTLIAGLRLSATLFS